MSSKPTCLLLNVIRAPTKLIQTLGIEQELIYDIIFIKSNIPIRIRNHHKSSPNQLQLLSPNKTIQEEQANYNTNYILLKTTNSIANFVP